MTPCSERTKIITQTSLARHRGKKPDRKTKITSIRNEIVESENFMLLKSEYFSALRNTHHDCTNRAITIVLWQWLASRYSTYPRCTLTLSKHFCTPQKHYPPNCPRPIPSYPPHKTGNAAPHMRRANKRDRNLWSGTFSMIIRRDTMILNYVWNTPVAHYGIDTIIDQISPSPKWRSKI